MELHHEHERTTPRLALGIRLRRLREGEGLTLRELAPQIKFQFGYISRVERGEQLPSEGLAEALDRRFGITDLPFVEMLEMARDSAVPNYGRVFLASERKARRIQLFGSSIIPGLLQTPEYSRALFRATKPGWSVEEVTSQVELRLSRRRAFKLPEPPFFWAIVDEAALRRPVGGPAVMAAQLRHMHEALENSRITLQVLPFEQGEYPMMGGTLALLTLRDGATIGYVESFASGEAVEAPERILELTQMFDAARAKALPQAASVALIGRYMEEYKNALNPS